MEDRPAGGDQIAEMHRILRTVLGRERLTDAEVEFLRGLRIGALEQFLDGVERGTSNGGKLELAPARGRHGARSRS